MMLPPPPKRARNDSSVPHLKNLPMESWAECPRRGQFVSGTSMKAIKPPLLFDVSAALPDQGDRFDATMLMETEMVSSRRVGLVVDLIPDGENHCYTSQQEWEDWDVEYVHINPKGALQLAQDFNKKVSAFVAQHPGQNILVYCVDGFNISGFAIVSWMITNLHIPLEKAMKDFAQSRSPGIYSQYFVDMLVQLFPQAGSPLSPLPALPHWAPEDWLPTGPLQGITALEPSTPTRTSSSSSSASSSLLLSSDLSVFANPAALLSKPDSISNNSNNNNNNNTVVVRFLSLCHLQEQQFPVMLSTNISLSNAESLVKYEHLVSWMPVGQRRFLVILSDGVFFIDRHMNVTKTELAFPPKQDQPPLFGTVIDCMIVADNGSVERLLLFDLLILRNVKVGDRSLPTRLGLIQSEIIQPRAAIAHSSTGMHIRLRDQYPLSKTEYMIDKFLPTLTHAYKGLLFTPTKSSYAPGQVRQLEWPSSAALLVKHKQSENTTVEYQVYALRADQSHLMVGSLQVASSHVIEDNSVVLCTTDNSNEDYSLLKWRFVQVLTKDSPVATRSQLEKLFSSFVSKQKLISMIPTKS